MRKILSMIMVFVITVSLTACNQKKPSDKAMQAGREAIRAADTLLDKKADVKTTMQKIDSIAISMEHIEYEENKTPDFDVDTAIIELSVAVSKTPENADDMREVLEKRNELAKVIGENKRVDEEK